MMTIQIKHYFEIIITFISFFFRKKTGKELIESHEFKQ